MAHPCPVCHRPDWCAVGEDAVMCCRVQSDKTVDSESGHQAWLHPIDQTYDRPEPAAKVEKLPLEEIERRAKIFYGAPGADEYRRMVASRLGVCEVALANLRVGLGFDKNGRFSSWPCRDAERRIVGIVRRYEDGTKLTMPGTSTGLFYDRDMELTGTIFIVEGGSDVAACLSVGIKAIGRPSNLGGTVELKRMLAGLSCRPVVIGERDEKPEKRGTFTTCPVDCEGCNNCWPGLFGAKKTAEALGCRWVLVPPGSKDIREAISKGLIWSDLITGRCTR